MVDSDIRYRRYPHNFEVIKITIQNKTENVPFKVLQTAYMRPGHI